MAKGFVFRGGRDPQALYIPSTIQETNWVASSIGGVVQNDVVFGGPITTQTSVNYPVTFDDNVTGNDFTNLSPQTFTFSSASTTGPITITKEVGQDQFTGKFKGAQLRVFQPSEPPIIYFITEVTDNDTLVAYYQPGPSQGATLANLVNNFGGPTDNVGIFFLDVNGTPDPNIQFLRHGNFEEQTSTAISSPGFFKGASINRYFNIPANATNIVGLNELPNIQGVADNRGIRAYALIFDNKDAFISTSQGVRKIAKIENGNTFINIAGDYGTETWDQAGGSLQFITPFAMELFAANRATNTDWANAVPIDISSYTQVTLAFALDTVADDQDASTLGAQLVYETLVFVGDTFDANDFSVIELNIDATTIGDASSTANNQVYHLRRESTITGVTIPSGFVYTPIDFNVLVNNFGNTDAMWDSSTKRFTPTVAGVWNFNFTGQIPNDANANFTGAAILKNGTNLSSFVSSIDHAVDTIGVSIYMNGTTDYIQFTLASNTQLTNRNITNSSFDATLLHKIPADITIEGEWAKVKYYEVINTNTVRFFANENGEIDVPVVAKVIK
jgi:hypothetical protein